MKRSIILTYSILLLFMTLAMSVSKDVYAVPCPTLTITPINTQAAGNLPSYSSARIRFTVYDNSSVTSHQVDLKIDWGDGTIESPMTQGDHYHNYLAIGNYTVKVSIISANYGTGCTYPIDNPAWEFTAVIPRMYDPPALNITIPSINPFNVCQGEPVDFTAILTGTKRNGDLYVYDIKWNFNVTGDISHIYTIPATEATGTSVTHSFNTPGTYRVLAFVVIDDHYEGDYKGVYMEINVVVTACCHNSFSPIPNKKYVLSAWVRETIPTNTVVTTYNNPAITLSFDGSATTFSSLKGKGPIIDGWQRIEEEFVVPSTATSIKIDLKNLGSNDTYFDDVRIHPFNANMQSYVYDPDTKRLAAVLDENNYGMIYEYDEEGALIRVKKETERGVKTATESFNNLRKN